MKLPEYLPDWSGQTVVIAASGPSQRQADIERARGWAVVITINETWRLAPWCDAIYACDERWWRRRGPWPGDYSGLRFIGFGEYPGCIACNVTAGDAKMHWCGTKLGAGANSGFQAINLAAAAGSRKIVLLGFDMQHTGDKKHWHPDHEMGNPEAKMLKGCATLLNGAAPHLAARGVDVINATRETALRCFRRVSIDEALSD